MQIDGKLIAETILTGLTQDVGSLTARGIMPTLAVVLVGDNPASLAYIKQKQKAADKIGSAVVFSHQDVSIGKTRLRTLVEQFNQDPKVHGLIIQRPVPKELGDVSDVLNAVLPAKDIDGFLPDSPFDVPVAAAVGEILKSAFSEQKTVNRNAGNFEKDFLAWLRKQHMVIIGRGETAGAPIARYLEKQRCATSIIHSQTPDPQEIMKRADCIISCVGKERVVTKETIKPGAILISVGIWRDETGKLRGDYNEEDIAQTASFYTPTPGGVGPVNVACLMQNLVKACMMNT